MSKKSITKYSREERLERALVLIDALCLSADNYGPMHRFPTSMSKEDIARCCCPMCGIMVVDPDSGRSLGSHSHEQCMERMQRDLIASDQLRSVMSDIYRIAHSVPGCCNNYHDDWVKKCDKIAQSLKQRNVCDVDKAIQGRKERKKRKKHDGFQPASMMCWWHAGEQK